MKKVFGWLAIVFGILSIIGVFTLPLADFLVLALSIFFMYSIGFIILGLGMVHPSLKNRKRNRAIIWLSAILLFISLMSFFIFREGKVPTRLENFVKEFGIDKQVEKEMEKLMGKKEYKKWKKTK